MSCDHKWEAETVLTEHIGDSSMAVTMKAEVRCTKCGARVLFQANGGLEPTLTVEGVIASGQLAS